ncbi:hypothetical protein MMC10_010743 [Thelotrema lepadinum]|nr:hypothetical protein [Thelotrema lepadinum]
MEDLHRQAQKEVMPDETRKVLPPTPDRVEEALLALLREFTSGYIVVDALDEFTDQKLVLRFLRKAAESKTTRVLITSRKEADIERSLRRMASECIDLQNSEVDADIRRYIEHKVEADDIENRLCRRPPWVRKAIRDALSSKANGMFRWVVCQLEVLQDCDHELDIIEALASLPETLDQIYARILLRIPDRHRRTTLRVLQWLIHSKLPLSVDELAEILVADPSMQPPFDARRRLFDPEDVLRHCGSFVRCDYSMASTFYWESCRKVRIAHHSIQEFLLSKRVFGSDYADFTLEEPAANLSIARTCLTYLMQLQHTPLPWNGTRIDLPLWIKPRTDLPLMTYAVHF